MKLTKTIRLYAYAVSFVDTRQPKPRTERTETVILDGGRLSALSRLGMRPAGYIAQQFERNGYTVATIRRGETINANVDLAELWDKTMNEIRQEQFKALTAQLGGGSDAAE